MFITNFAQTFSSNHKVIVFIINILLTPNKVILTYRIFHLTCMFVHHAIIYHNGGETTKNELCLERVRTLLYFYINTILYVKVNLAYLANPRNLVLIVECPQLCPCYT